MSGVMNSWDEILLAVHRLGEDPRDEDALTMIVFELNRRLPRYLLSEFSRFDVDDADGVTGQVIRIVWKKAFTFRGSTAASVRNWLYKIAYTTGVAYSKKKDFYKKIKVKTKRRSWVVHVDSLEAIDGSQVAVDDRIREIADEKVENYEEVIIRAAGLKELRAQLTPRQQQVFDGLADGKNLTTIAKELDISRSAATQLRDAINKKRKKVFDDAEKQRQEKERE